MKVRFIRNVTTKAGLAFVRGEQAEGQPDSKPGWWSVRSARTGMVTAVPESSLRPVQE